MDHDDPEQRISELERQLAAGAAAGGGLSAAHIHNVAFSKPPMGKRGYHEDEVDAFLDRVEAALQDPPGHPLTAEEVRNVAFSKPPIGRRGYNQDEVDAFLDLVAGQFGSGHGAQPKTGGLPSATPGGTRHGAGETWPRRIRNAVTGFRPGYWTRRRG
jgi:DivIVA domain-containing protein